MCSSGETQRKITNCNYQILANTFHSTILAICNNCVRLLQFKPVLRYLLISLFSGIYAFIILKDGVEWTAKSVAEDLTQLIKKKIAAFAVPNQFLVRNLMIFFFIIINLVGFFVYFFFPADSAWSTQDPLREDNASYSEEDSSQPAQ